MLNNNHKNSDCEFSEMLVSYIYDETDKTEKSAFEKHLISCTDCADELEAFSGLHFSINDWKSSEFDTLSTPVIEIPYQKTDHLPSKISWLAGLRNLLTLTPTMMIATASLVLLIATVGILLFAFSSRQNNLVAEGNKTNPILQPTVDKTPIQSNGNENNSSDKEVNSPNIQKPSTPEVAVKTTKDSKNSQVVKVSNNSRPAQKPENKNLPKNKDIKPGNNNKTDNPSRIINDDDEEDNTLRLAEIFDEIDTRD